VLVCLAASETFLTIRYNREHARIEAERGGRDLCTKAAEMPELIYTRVPGTCDSNAHGFRGTDYGYHKEQGVFRIVIIGDSVAEGQGVAYEDRFAQVLERNLNGVTADEGQKVEVIVLALSGYSTSQELYLLEHEAFNYSPDLIVWTYVLNDPADPVFHNANGQLGRYYFKPVSHTASFVTRKLFEINERINSGHCGTGYFEFLHCVYWDQVAANIKKVADLGEKHRVPVIFLLHPIFEETGNFYNYALAPLHARLAAAATSVGLPVVDVLKAYQGHEMEALRLPQEKYYDPLHPNAAGHKIIADYLQNFIVANNYLANSPH
jgi:lysophospholipase L1-like esterase